MSNFSRLRKVKCGEERPACLRCIAGSRVCDGYGIWGGGGHTSGPTQCTVVSKRSRGVSRPSASIGWRTTCTEETVFFEWFMFRTAVKLPGSFICGFWTTLLFQASESEPAVLHAVVALSSVHKRGAASGDGQKIATVPIEQERLTLRHYSKAIDLLQPHFSARDAASCRVALITCITFVCLELLRGDFETAQSHLQNGLKVLAERHMLPDESGKVLHLKPCCDSTDAWIIEVFSRLHLQLELFKPSDANARLFLQPAEAKESALVFNSLNAAWQQLERLLNRIFLLTHQYRRQAQPGPPSPRAPAMLLQKQVHLRIELTAWLDIFGTFERSRYPRHVAHDKAYQLPLIHHTMARIMTETCLQVGDEMAFDSYTIQFALLVQQSARLWALSLKEESLGALPRRRVDIAKSIIDIGWIPPLYYTAVKCRVHRIRLQAIRLLESSSHREGFWDSTITACVARKVMEIEEGDFYDAVEKDDDFPLDSAPQAGDLSSPKLPESRRIREVEMELSGTPLKEVSLFRKQDQRGVCRKVLVSTYDVLSQRWLDSTNQELHVLEL